MDLELYTDALKDFQRVWLEEAYGEEDVLDYVECLIELDDLDEAIRILYDGIAKFPSRNTTALSTLRLPHCDR
jgi:thioredoxin-like negative regulator of GroEL